MYISARKIALFLALGTMAFGQGSQLPKYTVATLPAASTLPTYTVQVIDGTTATDCTTGGASGTARHNVLCVAAWNGSAYAWSPVSSASGVTNVATDSTSGITGGPITSTGTIACAQGAASQFGCVKPDGTTITASGGVLSAAGGSSPLPSNAVFVFGPTSVNDDDNHVLSPAIPIASFTAAVAGIVTVTNTGTNGLSAGDWVSMRAATGWPTSGTLALGTGLTQFQVLSSGLSTTQFEINVGSLTPTLCSSSCGNAYSAMNYLPQNVVNAPGMPAAANANMVMLVPSDVTIRGMCAAWATVYHPYRPAVLGKPVYLIINNFNNDFAIGRTSAQIKADYQCVLSAAHTDGDLVLVGSPTGISVDQSLSSARYTTWFDVKNWLKAQIKSPANIANSNKYFDYFASIGEVLNNAYNPNIIASNSGMGVAGAKHGADAIVTALVTGAGTPAPDAGTMYSGDIGQADNSFGNGLVLPLPVDSGRAFQVMNAAGTRTPINVNTGRGSLPDILTFGSPGPIRTVTEGNTGAVTNFEPVTVIHDAAGGVFNSAIKEWLLYNAFTPNADVSHNNLIMTISGESYSGTNAPSLAAGKSVDFGFSYNSASTLTLNHFFVHVNGDTLDSLHAVTGGQVCIGVNTGEATGGQKGCPTAAMFSVGTTGQFSINGTTGNPTLAGAPAGSYLKADGSGSGTPISTWNGITNGTQTGSGASQINTLQGTFVASGGVNGGISSKPFGSLPLTGWTAMNCYGDSRTSGSDATTTAKRYCNQIATSLGIGAPNNLAVGGSYAADAVKAAFNATAPGNTSTTLESWAVGVNDATNGLVGGYEEVFNSLWMAGVSWRSIAANRKYTGASFGSLPSNWTTDTTYTGVTGIQTTTINAAAVFPYTITSPMQLPVIWYECINSDDGRFTVTDSGWFSSIYYFQTRPNTVMDGASYNGTPLTLKSIVGTTSQSVCSAVFGGPTRTPGTYSLTVEKTNAAGSVKILGVGVTPADTISTTTPFVMAWDVYRLRGDLDSSVIQVVNNDIHTNCANAVSWGMNVGCVTTLNRVAGSSGDSTTAQADYYNESGSMPSWCLAGDTGYWVHGCDLIQDELVKAAFDPFWTPNSAPPQPTYGPLNAKNLTVYDYLVSGGPSSSLQWGGISFFSGYTDFSAPVSISSLPNKIGLSTDSTGLLVDSGAGNSATVTAVGSGLTSAACASGMTCTASRGLVQIVGGTFTTGIVFSLSWAATPTVYQCSFTEQYVGSWHGFQQSATGTTTGVSAANFNSLSGVTTYVAYVCLP